MFEGLSDESDAEEMGASIEFYVEIHWHRYTEQRIVANAWSDEIAENILYYLYLSVRIFSTRSREDDIRKWSKPAFMQTFYMQSLKYSQKLFIV